MNNKMDLGAEPPRINIDEYSSGMEATEEVTKI